jgi:hypothetical protein
MYEDCVDFAWIKLTADRIQSLMFILINIAESPNSRGLELLWDSNKTESEQLIAASREADLEIALLPGPSMNI